jgi:hypothetical protein
MPLLQARTIDELMFGTLAPPGMCVWAPSTCGLDRPPALPAPTLPSHVIALTVSTLGDGTPPGVSAQSGGGLPPLSRTASHASVLPSRTGDRLSLPRRAAAAPSADEEWAKVLRGQLQDLFSTIDASTRLTLLMPLAPNATGDAPPTEPALPPSVSSSSASLAAPQTTDAAPDSPAAATGATPGPGASPPRAPRHLPPSRLPWNMTSERILPSTSELQAHRHAIRAAEKAKLEMGDPAGAAIQHALDMRTASRRKRMPASQDHRSLVEVRRELLGGKPGLTRSEQQLPRLVEKTVFKEVAKPRRRGSVSGLTSGPFKSVDAKQQFQEARDKSRANLKDAPSKASSRRRGSFTVVNVIEAGSHSMGSNKTKMGLADVVSVLREHGSTLRRRLTRSRDRTLFCVRFRSPLLAPPSSTLR